VLRDSRNCSRGVALRETIPQRRDNNGPGERKGAAQGEARKKLKRRHMTELNSQILRQRVRRGDAARKSPTEEVSRKDSMPTTKGLANSPAIEE